MKTATAVTQSEPTDAHPAPETAEKAQLSGNRISPPAPPHALGNVRLRQRKARAFRSLCQDMVEWRRGDHCAERLRLGPERFPEGSKVDEVRALEAVIEEVNQWPDVRQACQEAFALIWQRKHRGPANGRPAEDLNPTGSNCIKPNQTSFFSGDYPVATSYPLGERIKWKGRGMSGRGMVSMHSRRTCSSAKHSPAFLIGLELFYTNSPGQVSMG